MIEPTDEMIRAVRHLTGSGEVAAWQVASAVLALVERDYPLPDPMLLVDGRCAGCGHDVAEHKGLGCYGRAEPVTCACERSDSMLKAGRKP